MKILLVSVFEGGFQPQTIATAAGALSEIGVEIDALDVYIEDLRFNKVSDANLVAISVPLFDSIQPAIALSKEIRKINPRTHVTFFGQHATIHAQKLASTYGDSCIRGDWEYPLINLARYLMGNNSELVGVLLADDAKKGKSTPVYIGRNDLRVPARSILPPLDKYPQPHVERIMGSKQVVGATEIARGCHHKCLYCSVFAAYNGKVVLIPEDIVLEDAKNLVEQGMTHLSFIDADFFNAKWHGIKIIRKLHEKYPFLTYDFTTRVDHILENRDTFREMVNLGVKFVTSALEFPSEELLDEVEKQITVNDIREAIKFLREIGMKLNPTFIMFNPWTRLEDLIEFRAFIEDNNLQDLIDPVQYQTRLHLYKGSPLLIKKSVKNLELTELEFHYEWKHPDPRVDELYSQLHKPVENGVMKRCCLKC